MPAPKPVILTTAATNPAPNKAPEPLLVITAAGANGVGPVTRQAAEANLAGGADLATTVTKVNNILTKLRAAGILVP